MSSNTRVDILAFSVRLLLGSLVFSASTSASRQRAARLKYHARARQFKGTGCITRYLCVRATQLYCKPNIILFI
ncbi:hypothetical protein GALMADRAFT_399589 [Galerina marginata CBS 339.88]|uniref:Secreted protein n=1 Tax=Galerina marginata (strain CBS 339.88) TaxID=685588 RepID=A0A067U3N6_GALM3|nr:hypothetical protein GALMADRAFT_399589 [Galerina marginata CBS 339.88]